MVIGRVAGRYTQAFFFWAVSVFFTFLMGSKGPHSTHLRRGSEDPRGAAGGWCGFFKRSVGGGGGGLSWFCDSCGGDEAGDGWVLVERARAMMRFLLLREYGIGSIGVALIMRSVKCSRGGWSIRPDEDAITWPVRFLSPLCASTPHTALQCFELTSYVLFRRKRNCSWRSLGSGADMLSSAVRPAKREKK